MEPLDDFWGVFNSHDSDHRRGVKAVDTKFGKGTYRQYIAPFKRKGIMSIFYTKPTKYTRLYAKAVTNSVNKRIRERGGYA